KDRWRDVLIEAPFHCRLVVEKVEVRRAARLEQKDHPFGAGSEIGKLPGRGPSGWRVQERVQGCRAQTKATARQQISPRPESLEASTVRLHLQPFVITSSRFRIRFATAV